MYIARRHCQLQKKHPQCIDFHFSTLGFTLLPYFDFHSFQFSFLPMLSLVVLAVLLQYSQEWPPPDDFTRRLQPLLFKKFQRLIAFNFLSFAVNFLDPNHGRASTMVATLLRCCSTQCRLWTFNECSTSSLPTSLPPPTHNKHDQPFRSFPSADHSVSS